MKRLALFFTVFLTLLTSAKANDATGYTTEITPQFFNYTSGTYDSVEMTDNYGVTFSAVYLATEEYMQFYTRNANGKGSGVVIDAINEDYIIESIDIELTENSNGVTVWKSSSAYPAMKTTVTPNTDGTKKIGSYDESTAGIEINDYAFAVIPSASVPVYLKKITVHYKRLAEGDVAPAPGVPVVQLGDTELTNNGRKNVTAGSEITVTCPEAVKVEGTLNGRDFSETLPFVFTVNEDTILEVWGLNIDDVKGGVFKYQFLIKTSDNTIPETGSAFVHVASNDELEEGYYVIAKVVDTEEDATNYALSTKIQNGTIVATSNIKIEIDNTGTSDINVLTTTGEEVLVVNLVNVDGEWGLKTLNYGDGAEGSQKYIYAPSSNGNVVDLSEEFHPVYIRITELGNAVISFDDGGNSLRFNTTNKIFNYNSRGYQTQLYKFDESYNAGTTRIATTLAEVCDGVEEYYTLEGLKVRKTPPSAGLYIVKKGNKSRKVLIK